MPTTAHKQTVNSKHAQLATEDKGGKLEASSLLINTHQTQHQHQTIAKGRTKLTRSQHTSYISPHQIPPTFTLSRLHTDRKNNFRRCQVAPLGTHQESQRQTATTYYGEDFTRHQPAQMNTQVEDDDVSQHQDHVIERNTALQQRQHLELVANLHKRERAAHAAGTQQHNPSAATRTVTQETPGHLNTPMPDARTRPPQHQQREAAGLWHQYPQQWER